MTITVIKPGFVRLTAENGVYCIPEGRIYSVVECRTKNIPNYRAAEATEVSNDD